MMCNTCNGMRFVLNELCSDCSGTGLAIDPARDTDCSWCHGRGETHAWCSSGDYVPEQCQCENPKPANPIEAELLSRLEVA